jgi:Protein of unknown function (DUF3795)
MNKTMHNLDKNKLTTKETCLIAPCGIYCGACDRFLGKSNELAKELYRVIDGFNIVDVAPIVLGVDRDKMQEFLAVLAKLRDAVICPGCNAGGGNPVCPVKACVQEKGFLTCAECDRMPCSLIEPQHNNDPMTACVHLEIITKRYANWNIKNLEHIKAVGYRQLLDEMQEKVKKGLLTSDVISSEPVITQALNKFNI